MSTSIMFLAGVRAVGSKGADGNVYGGIYYPEHFKNGKQVSARWEGNVAINGRDWTDETGQRREGRRTYLRLVVWNSKNAAPGKGLADIFAKYVSPGKELSCEVEPESFDKRVFVNGQPILDAQGQPITTNAIVFRVTGKLELGDDSSKQIAAEVGRWNPAAPDIYMRPPQWNVQGTQDNQAWKQIVATKSAMVYDGQSKVFGYARVLMPEGAQPVTGQMPQTAAAPNMTATQQTTMPNMTANQQPIMPNTIAQPVTNQMSQTAMPTMAAQQTTMPNMTTAQSATMPANNDGVIQVNNGTTPFAAVL